MADDIRFVFGDPPLLEHDDENAYFDLWDFLVVDIKPIGMVEWTWSRVLADLTWEILRYRRFRAMMMVENSAAPRQLDIENVKALRRRKRMDDKTKARTIERWEHGYIAQGFFLNIEDFERIECLLASAEQRYNNTLRKIEFRRHIVAKRVRNTVDRLIAQSDSVTLVPSNDPREVAMLAHGLP